MVMVVVVLLLLELVDVDVEELNERVHLMRDVGLVLVLLDNDDDDDDDDDHLLDSDRMKQDMYIEFLDQFEFVSALMDYEIQNEVFHLKTNEEKSTLVFLKLTTFLYIVYCFSIFMLTLKTFHKSTGM
jgi:hypothetical protein